jgi:hypothetical protein
MKYRFKTTVGALALMFMLLFGAAAFAHTTNTSMGNPNMSSAGTPEAGNQRLWVRRHRRHDRWRRHRHRYNR